MLVTGPKCVKKGKTGRGEGLWVDVTLSCPPVCGDYFGKRTSRKQLFRAYTYTHW